MVNKFFGNLLNFAKSGVIVEDQRLKYKYWHFLYLRSLGKLSFNVRIYLLLLMVFALGGSLWFAAKGVSDFKVSFEQKNEAEQVEKRKLIIKEDVLSIDSVWSYVESLQMLNPNVQFTKAENGVQLSIAKAEDYPYFVIAMQSFLGGFNTQVISGWKANNLCVGSCQSKAATATLVAYKKSIVKE
jgi:hypothetical protein